jgi:hypothetical protein
MTLLSKCSRMGPMSHHTLLIQASLKGWSVLVDGEPLMGSWSRALAEEAAMEEALNIRRSGKAVEILVKGLFGPARMIAQEGCVPVRRPVGSAVANGEAAMWAAAVEKVLP